MKEKIGLSREAFFIIAEASGLDLQDPHMEELHGYLQHVLPGLRGIEELDLADLEPFVPLLSKKESPL